MSAEVQVWIAELADFRGEAERLARSLCSEEHERAERLREEVDRERFVLRRALLRAVLARWTGVEPSRLSFSRGHRGKPRLAGGPCFSASSSGDVAVFALTEDAEVGVDVERVTPASTPVPDLCFTEREARSLLALPERAKTRASLARWTCKEAWLKATGEGLSFPPERVEVELGPPTSFRVLGDPGASHGWSIFRVDAGPDLSCYLAVQHASPRPLVRRLPVSLS